jgi:hypothetical protein
MSRRASLSWPGKVSTLQDSTRRIAVGLIAMALANPKTVLYPREFRKVRIGFLERSGSPKT